MNLKIRSAREEDAAAVVDLLNPIIRDGRFTIMDRELSTEDQIGFIRALPEPAVYHLAFDSGSSELYGLQEVLPLCTDESAFRHVGAIGSFVAMGYRGQGIGRQLCEATFLAAQGRGYRKLMANIRADNHQALGFYLKMGFRIIGTARDHALVAGRYIDEILTERLLL